MIPIFKIIPEKKLVGKCIKKTLADNKTFELWQSFMPRRKEIRNNLTNELLSLQVYNPSLDFKDFNLETVHEKWAAVEVSDFNTLPDEMETFTLPAGLYTVFLYKGNPNEFADTFRYIFEIWLPASDYLLDTRPHFEILGEKYKNNDPDSEEEVWIPIKEKRSQAPLTS